MFKVADNPREFVSIVNGVIEEIIGGSDWTIVTTDHLYPNNSSGLIDHKGRFMRFQIEKEGIDYTIHISEP